MIGPFSERDFPGASDLVVAINIENQQPIFVADPSGALAGTIVVEVEQGAAGAKLVDANTVAVEVNDNRLAAVPVAVATTAAAALVALIAFIALIAFVAFVVFVAFVAFVALIVFVAFVAVV